MFNVIGSGRAPASHTGAGASGRAGHLSKHGRLDQLQHPVRRSLRRQGAEQSLMGHDPRRGRDTLAAVNAHHRDIPQHPPGSCAQQAHEGARRREVPTPAPQRHRSVRTLKLGFDEQWLPIGGLSQKYPVAVSSLLRNLPVNP